MRKQLTLFLEPEQSVVIEGLRKTYNPKQYDLIKSHITLCREDEIIDITQIKENLAHLKFKPFKLALRGFKRFNEGKGVLIEVDDAKNHFKNLRIAVLHKVVDHPRDHKPHITLMHPRNSTCTALIYETIEKSNLPQEIRISKISLIEQEMGKKWFTLDETALTA